MDTTSINVRDATPADSDALLGLVHELAAHHGDVGELTAEGLRRDAFGDAPWVQVLVAEAEDGLVGYTALSRIGRLHYAQRGLNMHHLCVSAAHRGQGVGQALVAAARDRAQAEGCIYITVGTDPDNLHAQGFYLANGFERRPSYPPYFAMQVQGEDMS
ncbi:MAG: N-acetyltransferase family protein [Paracoccaceae bacterium]